LIGFNGILVSPLVSFALELILSKIVMMKVYVVQSFILRVSLQSNRVCSLDFTPKSILGKNSEWSGKGSMWGMSLSRVFVLILLTWPKIHGTLTCADFIGTCGALREQRMRSLDSSGEQQSCALWRLIVVFFFFISFIFHKKHQHPFLSSFN
jgi:hypothetical protein